LEVFFVIFLLLVYAWQAYCLQTIAKRTGTEDPWLAWIPIGNIYLMCKIADLSGWMILLFFIPLVNIIIMIYIWMEIAQAVGMSRTLGIFIIIPLLNFIIMGVLAFGSVQRSQETA